MKNPLLNPAILILVAVALSSCEKFYPDPLDPRLPVYSETGKNQAGALVNNQAVVDHPRASFFGGLNGNSFSNVFGTDSIHLVLNLSGTNSTNLAHTILFELKDLDAQDWNEMKFGNGKRFVFDNESVKAKMDIGLDWDFPRVEQVEGTLWLKHIPNLGVMAGTFGFRLRNSNRETFNVHYGRFDLKYGNVRN